MDETGSTKNPFWNTEYLQFVKALKDKQLQKALFSSNCATSRNPEMEQLRIKRAPAGTPKF